MQLSGQQLKELQLALINAFPNTTSLEQMLLFELGKNLNAIAGEGRLEDIVFKLIQVANSQAWVTNLVDAAYNYNPGNPGLRAIAERLLPNHDAQTYDANFSSGSDAVLDSKNDSLIIYEFVLSGRVSEVSKQRLEAIVEHLREITGDVHLTLIKISSGSIKLVLEGSEKGFQFLKLLLESGELIQILGISVQEIRQYTLDNSLKPLLLDILRNSKKQWNAWRENNSSMLIDLRNVDLSGVYLGKTNRRGNNVKADLEEINLSGVILSNAVLKGANLNGANLSEANLSKANLSELNGKIVVLNDANCSRTNFEGANLKGACLRRANLSSADLSNTDIRDADFIDANLSGTNFSGAKVQGALFGNNLGLSQKAKSELVADGVIFFEPPE
ncbi:pentapeptide repeat-containing protein [Nostoc sp. LEGE 06077]|uniref:pentapeptide repeat-containing protein n=1 Tax=Nostoc sp. LEGE 06077 TaxID=915325 RepID=UPI00187E6C96|nr:pentapeptide repeat-containing protein [Nostoc sp. LEGE 06077]MBE9209706.1 pentapeptide repeat-containing protein [Nostoc sp. LEGE 06077]